MACYRDSFTLPTKQGQNGEPSGKIGVSGRILSNNSCRKVCECWYCIHVTQDRAQFLAFVNMVLNLWIF
jgi:hypothetical protein